MRPNARWRAPSPWPHEVGDLAVIGYVHSRVGLVRAMLHADEAPLRGSLEQAREAGYPLDAGVAYQGLAGEP